MQQYVKCKTKVFKETNGECFTLNDLFYYDVTGHKAPCTVSI